MNQESCSNCRFSSEVEESLRCKRMPQHVWVEADHGCGEWRARRPTTDDLTREINRQHADEYIWDAICEENLWNLNKPEGVDRYEVHSAKDGAAIVTTSHDSEEWTACGETFYSFPEALASALKAHYRREK